MASNEYHELMERLADEEYRREFASEYVGTGLAYQIRSLREDRGWTQKELAQRTGQAQGTISQLENPSYGRHSISTLKRLAAAFDVALLVKFAPFSELADWILHLTLRRLAPPSFADESQPAFTRRVQLLDDSTKDWIPSVPAVSQAFMEIVAAEEEPRQRESATEERRREYEAVARNA